MSEIILVILIPIVIYLIVTTVVSVIASAQLEKDGEKIEKRTRYRSKTYNDGFGRYTVDIKDQEWVVVPKDK